MNTTTYILITAIFLVMCYAERRDKRRHKKEVEARRSHFERTGKRLKTK